MNCEQCGRLSYVSHKLKGLNENCEFYEKCENYENWRFFVKLAVVSDPGHK